MTSRKISLAKLDELTPGKWKYVRAEGKDLILVNTEDGIRGYVNFCTHMGGKLRCVGEKFQCDWHGAEFDCKTGEALEGTAAPVGSKLENLDLLTENGEIFWNYTPKKSPWATE